MRASARAAIAFSVLGAVLSVDRVAEAADRRIVVAAAPGDPIGDRLEKELTALDIRADRVDDANHCARVVVGARLEEKHGWVAACSDGEMIRIFTRDASGNVRFRQVVAESPDAEEPTSRVALRAAEISRAILEHGAGDSDPPPTFITYDKSDTAGIERVAFPPAAGDASPTPRRDERTPPWLLSAGVSRLMGVDAGANALSAKVALRVARQAMLGARLDLPIGQGATAQYFTPTWGLVSTTMKPIVFGMTVDLPLVDASSRFVPTLGAGLGAVLLDVSAAPYGGSFTKEKDLLATAQANVGAGGSLRIYGPVRLAVDALIGTTLQRLTLSVGGDDVASWGQPFGAVAMRVEVTP